MGFPRQEYWSGLPFHSPGDLPDPGVELTSPVLAEEFFTTEPPGWPTFSGVHLKKFNLCLFAGLSKAKMDAPKDISVLFMFIFHSITWCWKTY